MITIARAQVEDANEYLDVKIRSFSEEVKLYGFGPPGYDSLENQIRGIRDHYCYKILDGDKIIGGIGVMDRGNGDFWIGFIFVDIEYQSKGIGALAINFLDREFPGASRWTLETPYLSYRNHHFYEKMGFVKIGETEPEVDLNGFYLFLYEKIRKEIRHGSDI